MINIFWSKYSNYSFDQLNNDKYNNAIKNLLEQVQDEEVKRKIEEILYEGGYDDFTVNSNMTTPDNIWHEMDRRLYFASLLISDPEVFEKISQENVILFHGTNSTALPNILKYGMQSEAETIRKGQKVSTGEISFKPRDFISFTDKLNVALDYAALKPSARTYSSFGVFVGISTDDLKGDKKDIRTITVPSDVPEVGVMKKLPAQYIRMFAVPHKKVREVKKMIEEHGLNIDVVPSEGFVNAVQLTNKSYGYAKCIDPNCMIIKGRTEPNKKFKKEDIKSLTHSRKESSIKRIYSKIKDIFKGRDENENTRDE